MEKRVQPEESGVFELRKKEMEWGTGVRRAAESEVLKLEEQGRVWGTGVKRAGESLWY